jgi:hypothetical protein
MQTEQKYHIWHVFKEHMTIDSGVEALQQTISLYEKIPETLKKDHTAVSIFFLYQGNSGLEFVKKKSFRGFFIKIFHSITKFFGYEKYSHLNLENNLKKIAAILSNSFTASQEALEKVAATSKLPIAAVKKEVEEVREIMAIFEKYVVNSPKTSPSQLAKKVQGLITGIKPWDEQPPPPESQKPNTSSSPLAPPQPIPPSEKPSLPEQPISQKATISDILKQNFSPSTINTLPVPQFETFLSSYPENEAFLTELQKNIDKEKAAKNEVAMLSTVRNAFSGAVLRAIALPHTEKEELTMRQLLQALSPQEPPVLKDPVNLKNIALVLGDQFIRGTRFEGDVGTERYTKLAAGYIQQLPDAEKSNALLQMKSTLDNCIDLRTASLSSKNLRGQLHNKLSQPGLRCLLLGGWVGHAIVYEIERSNNDTYIFRVYNEGEGVSLLKPGISKFSLKRSPCIGIKKIQESQLFSQFFLSQLLAITTIQGKPQKDSGPPGAIEILYTHMLPSLGGKVEKLPDDVQPVVSSQKSGTCAYRSLHAFFARSLSQKEFKRFKFGFETYLLKQFVYEFSCRTQKPIHNTTVYEATREEYAIMKRSVAYYAKTFEKVQPLLDTTAIATARNLEDTYTHLLHELEEKMWNFEKSSQTFISTIPSTLQPKKIELPYTTAPEDVIPTLPKQNLLGDEQECFRLLDTLPSFTDPQFNQKYAEALHAISAKISKTQIPAFFKELCVYALKKVPSIASWDSMKLSPELALQAYEDLQLIARHLCAGIPEEPNPKPLPIVALTAIYGAEKMFWQTQHGKHLINKSFLGNLFNPFLLQIQTSDPFWTANTKELLDKASSNTTPSFFDKNIFENKQENKLGEPLQQAIWAWWNDQEAEILRKKVAESIDRDPLAIQQQIAKERTDILHEIQTLTAECEVCNTAIEKSETLINTTRGTKSLEEALNDSEIQQKLKAQLATQAKLKNTLLKKQRTLQEKNNTLAALQEDITNNPMYWPKNFVVSGPPESNEGLSYTAPFLFVPQAFFEKKQISKEPDLLPTSLRSFFNLTLQAQLLFFKTTETPGAVTKNCPLDLSIEDSARTKSPLTFSVNQHPIHSDTAPTLSSSYGQSNTTESIHKFTYETCTPADMYASAITFASQDTPWIERWYNKFCSSKNNFHADLEETEIPADITDLLQCLPQNTPCDKDEVSKLTSVVRSKQLQVESVISCFLENPSRLANNSWLNIFHAILFESNFLQQTLSQKNWQDIVSRFQHFFRYAIDNFLASSNMSAAANMTWLATSIQKHVKKVCLEKGMALNGIPQILDPHTIVTIFQEGLSPRFSNQLPVLLEAIVASCENAIDEMPNISSQELFACACLANALHNDHCIDESHKCLPRKADANSAAFSLRRYMTNLCEKTQTTVQAETVDIIQKGLRTSFATLYGIQDVSIKAKGSPDILEIYNNEKKLQATLFISTGLLIPEDKKTPSYSRALSEPHSLALSEFLGCSVHTIRQVMRCYLQGDTAYVKHLARDLFLRIHTPQDSKTPEVDIFTKEHGWLRLIKKDQKIANCKYLDTKFWRAQSGKTVYFLRKGLQLDAATRIMFSTTLDNTDQKTPVIQTEDSAEKLIVAHNPKINFFQSFESPEHTLYLTKNGLLQEIRFPRLNLSLLKVNEEWVRSDDTSWKLSESQFLPHLGVNTGFLLFKNDRGKFRAILPIHPSLPETEKLALSNRYAYDFQEEQHHANFTEYSVEKNKLIPITLEGRLYLATIYAEQGYIDDAEELLFAHEAHVTTREFSSQELELLRSLAYKDRSTGSKNASKNTEPRLSRLRLHSFFLLRQNIIESKIALDVDTAHNYLANLGSLPPLPADEELLIFRDSTDPIIKKRVCALQNIPSNDLSVYKQDQIPIVLQTLSDVYLPLKQDEQTEKTILLQYTNARKHNDFPFNPSTVSINELLPYYRHLYDECEHVPSFSQAISSNLLQTVRYLATFGAQNIIDYKIEQDLRIYVSVKKIGAKLLDVLQFRFLFDIQRTSEEIFSKNPLYALKEEQFPAHMLRTFTEDLSAAKPLKISEEWNWYLQGSEGQSAEKKGIIDAYFQTVPTPSLPTQTIVSGHDLETGNEPALIQKFEQTKRDIEAAQTKERPYDYTFKKNSDLQTLCDVLKQKYTEEQQLLNEYELSLLKTVSFALTSEPHSYAEFASKKRTLPTIEELCIVCAKKHPADFLEKTYPELSPQGRDTLRKKVTDYLIQKQFVQQLERSLKQTQDCIFAHKQKADPLTIANLENSLGQCIAAHRAYAVSDENSLLFLLLETTQNILLRKEQVINIAKFIECKNTNISVALQMIMGGGKTSIILPILAFILAEPGTISVVDVPESLVNEVAEKLPKVAAIFHQYVHVVRYDRKLSRDTNYLEKFLETLRRIQQQGGCVLRHAKIKYSIISSLYEAHFENMILESPESAKRVRLISSILSLLQNGEKTQFDEIDTTLDPTVVFRTPIGISKSVDPKRADIVVDLLFDLTNSDVGKTIHIDFVQASNDRSAKDFKPKRPITQTIFEEEITPTLAECAIKRLSGIIPNLHTMLSTKDNAERLRNFLTNHTPFDQPIRENISKETEAQRTKHLLEHQESWGTAEGTDKLIIQKLQYTQELVQWIRTTFPDKEQINLVGVCAKAIRNILPISLLKECGAHYGRDPNHHTYVARPYAAPKYPKPTIYSDPYEQIIYSTQQLLYYGISENATRQILHNLQTSAKADILAGIPLKTTDGWKTFERLLGNTVNDYAFFASPPSQALTTHLQQQINKDRELLTSFLQHFLYPQISMNSKAISCTPQTLVGSSQDAFGFTGTLSAGILSKGMKVLPAIGTDGTTMLAIEAKMERNLSTVTIINDPPLAQVLSLLSGKDGPHVFIDSGRWLKEETTASFARKVLASCKDTRKEIRGIVFHDDAGDLSCIEYDDLGNLIEHPFSQALHATTDGSLLTIISQRHETGTDIAQMPTAKAIISIRKNMTKRDALQSAFRMRQILRTQPVSFLMNNEVHDDIGGQIWQKIINLGSKTIQALYESTPEKALQTLGASENVITALLFAKKEWEKQHTEKLTVSHLRDLEITFTQNLKITSATLWRYLVANEGSSEQFKNWIACQQRMREVIERPIRKILSEEDVYGTHTLLFQALQGLFIQDFEDSPFEQVVRSGSYTDIRTAVDGLVQKFSSFITIIQKLADDKNDSARLILENLKLTYGIKSDENLQDAVKKSLLECANFDELPTVVETSVSQYGQELEVEQLVELQQEQQVQLQQHTSEVVLSKKQYTDIATSTDGRYRPNDLLNSIYHQHLIFHAFDEIKTLEKNPILKTPISDRCLYSPNLFMDNTLNSPYTLSGQYILVSQEANEAPRYILLSHKDASKVKQGILNDPCSGTLRLISFDGEIVAQTQNADQQLQAFANEILLARVLGKLCTGKVNFSHEESTLLIKELQRIPGEEAQRREILKKMYENILSTLPQASKQYTGSWIQKILSQTTQSVGASKN